MVRYCILVRCHAENARNNDEITRKTTMYK